MNDISAKNNSYHTIATERDESWGLWVAGAGQRIVPSTTYYQVQEKETPFPWNQNGQGRILPYFGLVYITGGKGVIDADHLKAKTVEPGQIILINPDQWHNYRPLAATGWQEYWILFDGALARRWYKHHFLAQRISILTPGIHNDLIQLFEQLLSLTQTQPPYVNQIQAGLTMQILATIQSHIQAKRDGKGKATTSSIEKAKCYLHEQWNQTVDMNTLAHSLHISPRHFRRLFKESTGLSPNHYHMNLKINHAKRLLEQHLSVKEVAFQTGFDDPYHFSRLFKQRTDISPSSWAK